MMRRGNNTIFSNHNTRTNDLELGAKIRNTRKSPKSFCFTILGGICLLVLIYILWNRIRHTTTPLPDPPIELFDTLSNEIRLGSDLELISSDEFEGRAPGTRGESLVANFIAYNMKINHLHPPAQEYDDKTRLFAYIQPVPILKTIAHPISEEIPVVSVKNLANEKQDFVLETDVMIRTDLVNVKEINVQKNEIIFVGFGIDSQRWEWNDYKNVDVEGKVILCFVNQPMKYPKLFKAKKLTYFGRWTYKIEEARRRRAKGIILIHTNTTAGYPFSVIQHSKEQYSSKAMILESSLDFVLWINQPAIERMLKLNDQTMNELYESANDKLFTPKTLSLSISVQTQLSQKICRAKNVIGLVPGSIDEWILITAHHDHLGQSNSVKTNDTIYNGALDNASGVSVLLSLMRSLSQIKTFKRGLCFLSLTAEEPGLLGALHYISQPVVPLEKTIANINFDIMNIFGKTKDIVGLGSDLSSLGDLFKQAAQKEDLTISPDPNPEQGSYFRSDTHVFGTLAKIPAIYMWHGSQLIDQPNNAFNEKRGKYVKTRYHQVGDEYDPDWSMEGIIQQTRVALRLIYGLAISNITPVLLDE